MKIRNRIANWLEARGRRGAAWKAHLIARDICRLGQDWEPSIQRQLNIAKDSLYAASRELDLTADAFDKPLVKN